MILGTKFHDDYIKTISVLHSIKHSNCKDLGCFWLQVPSVPPLVFLLDLP